MVENKGFIRIKDKIMKDAEDEAKKILSAAEDQVKGIVDEKEAEAEKYKSSELEKIELEKKLLEDKMLAQAKLSARKAYFTARENVIDEIIAEAIKNIPRDAKYTKFLEGLLSESKADLKDPLTILVNKKDVAIAKKALSKTKLKGTITEGDIEAGLVIEDSSGRRIQESIDARLGRFKDEIRMRLHKIIEGEKSA